MSLELPQKICDQSNFRSDALRAEGTCQWESAKRAARARNGGAAPRLTRKNPQCHVGVERRRHFPSVIGGRSSQMPAHQESRLCRNLSEWVPEWCDALGPTLATSGGDCRQVSAATTSASWAELGTRVSERTSEVNVRDRQPEPRSSSEPARWIGRVTCGESSCCRSRRVLRVSVPMPRGAKRRRPWTERFRYPAAPCEWASWKKKGGSSSPALTSAFCCVPMPQGVNVSIRG